MARDAGARTVESTAPDDIDSAVKVVNVTPARHALELAAAATTRAALVGNLLLARASISEALLHLLRHR